MSTVYKGATYALTRREITFDPVTNSRSEVRTFQGTPAAIAGLTPSLEDSGINYHITTGPIWELQMFLNSTDETSEDVDRWEISTASHEASIFSHPDVTPVSNAFDAELAPGEKTWRGWAEDAVTDTAIRALTSVFDWVVQHLRNGITGYQEDTIILRRFRRISNAYAEGGGKANLRAVPLRYTTAQLGLPANVAFSLPTTPSGYSWLLRSQRVELIGSQTEQTYELEFAKWSTDLYAAAGGSFNW